MLALRPTKDANAMHEASSDSQSERAAVSAAVVASLEAIRPCPVCGEAMTGRKTTRALRLAASRRGVPPRTLLRVDATSGGRSHGCLLHRRRGCEEPAGVRGPTSKPPPRPLPSTAGGISSGAGRTRYWRGSWRPTRLVVLEFPSVAAAKRWYASEEYTKVKPIRLRTRRGPSGVGGGRLTDPPCRSRILVIRIPVDLSHDLHQAARLE